MALYDNKYWLLSHIRNSFISTDDTGMCELVMTSDDLPKCLKETLNVCSGLSDSESDSDDFSSESYGIREEGDIAPRFRSNTAVRLEKLDQVKKKTAKIKIIKWDSQAKNVSQEYLDDLFTPRDCSVRNNVPKKSLLTDTLERCTNVPLNPYIEFSKFDGSAHSIPVRKYKIFLTMLPGEHRNYPMTVCCIATARISELIGLILLKCSTVHGDFPLKPVSNYGLYITEEDGEVDTDFPCLDSRECVAKFGFTCLGLVEHDEKKIAADLDKSDNNNYTGVSLDDTFEQSVSREQTRIDEAKQTNDMQLMDVHNKAMEAPLYQSYHVFVVNKMRAKVEIHLGISGEKIEIDPVQQKSSKLVMFIKQKPVSHHMDSVAWCEITDIRSSRTTFRVVYSTSFGNANAEQFNMPGTSSTPIPLQTSASFKHYDFEADHQTATEIVQKINLILNLRSSLSRKEYQAARERKRYKKKSFGTSSK